MLKRARVWIVGPLAAVLAAATVSWSPATTLRLTDERGSPAADAYVRYHYYGYRINPVHPVTYVARGSVITRADADGRITIPSRFHVRPPFPLFTPPRVFVDHVYVPRLHNAFGPVAPGTMSHDGVFTIDDDRQHVTVFDVSGHPDRWEISLRYLFDCIRETLSQNRSMAPAVSADARTVAYARELIDHLRREYAAFVVRYGQTARERPPAPQWGSERDRGLWEEQIDTQLAREPLWGPFVERLWRNHLSELEALETSLK